MLHNWPNSKIMNTGISFNDVYKTIVVNLSHVASVITNVTYSNTWNNCIKNGFLKTTVFVFLYHKTVTWDKAQLLAISQTCIRFNNVPLNVFKP